jgi:hypothetical protein
MSYKVYGEAVEEVFGADVDYAMLVKIYGACNDNPASRYSPQPVLGAAQEFSPASQIRITSARHLWNDRT